MKTDNGIVQAWQGKGYRFQRGQYGPNGQVREVWAKESEPSRLAQKLARRTERRRGREN